MIEFHMSDMQISHLFDWQLAYHSLPFVLQGLPYTLLISFVSMFLGLLLGFFLALARGSERFLMRWPARAYISFMRGTPILVFLFILYAGLPMIGIQLSAVLAAILGFGLNSSAYIAEINRSSMNSIDVGQWESAKALNMGYWTSLFKIIVPQAVRIAIPPLSNVFLDIVKATSLAAVITVPELFQKAQIVAGRTYDSLTMYILIALIYWPICMLISHMQDRLEARYSKYSP